MRLKDQVALVTGGSRGIGRGIVLALAGEGAKVGFVYKGAEAAAKSLEADVAQAGGVAKAFQCDVTKYDDVEACVKAVEDALGGVNILVNNAGVIRDGLLVGMSQEDWKTVLDTNIGGTFNFCRVLAMPLARKRKGRIINISSVAATNTNKGQTNYSASKGAVNSFTRALAVELAGRNVTVNAVAPGFIETEMTEAVRNKGGDLIKKMIPLGRLGKPEDIARVVVFLASDDSSYLTGQVITVDGGLSLGAVAM